MRTVSSVLLVVLMASLLMVSSSQIICANVPDAISNNGYTRCNCATGFWWDGIQCQVNCSTTLRPGSKGYANSPKTCACESGYSWSTFGCSASNTNC